MEYGKLYKLSLDDSPLNSCYVFDIITNDWSRNSNGGYTLETVYVQNNDIIVYIKIYNQFEISNQIFIHLKSNKFIIPHFKEIKEI